MLINDKVRYKIIEIRKEMVVIFYIFPNRIIEYVQKLNHSRL